MAAFNYAPTPLQDTFLIPGGNTPGNGVQLFIYLAGSTTKTTVYMDSGGSSAWTNPVVLDSGGNLPSGGVIWIPTGISIKAVYAPANDTDPPTSPYRTIDNIVGINDTGVTSVSEWISGPTPTYISATSFSVAGDQTATFTPGRRLRTTNTAGTVYSTILTSSFGGGITTITVVSDSGALDTGLSAVAYGIIDPTHPSISEGLLVVKPMSTVNTTSFVGISGLSSDVIRTYIVDVVDVKPVTQGDFLSVRLSTNNGVNFIGTASSYSWQLAQVFNTSSFASGNLTDNMVRVAANLSTSQVSPASLQVRLINQQTGRLKQIYWNSAWQDSSGSYDFRDGVAFTQFSSAVNAMQLFMSSGANISTMTYAVYGRRTL